MVGRAPGGNGCSGSLEVTALRWLRGHSWLNSWFFRGGPPRSVGSAVTTPRQGPPSKLRPAYLWYRVPPPRSPPRSIIAGYHREGPHRFMESPPPPLCPLPRRSPLSVLSLFQPFVIADFLHSTFLDNLLILMR